MRQRKLSEPGNPRNEDGLHRYRWDRRRRFLVTTGDGEPEAHEGVTLTLERLIAWVVDGLPASHEITGQGWDVAIWEQEDNQDRILAVVHARGDADPTVSRLDHLE